VYSLKRAREQAKRTVSELAEQAGVDAELLSRLEEGDVREATIGTLREYAVALKDVWGWALAGLGEESGLCRQTSEPPMGEKPSSPSVLVPDIRIERGLTIRSTLRVRRNRQVRELELQGFPGKTHERV
jgi:transcriptional regulator with XRE-family HTH domain